MSVLYTSTRTPNSFGTFWPRQLLEENFKSHGRGLPRPAPRASPAARAPAISGGSAPPPTHPAGTASARAMSHGRHLGRPANLGATPSRAPPAATPRRRGASGGSPPGPRARCPHRPRERQDEALRQLARLCHLLGPLLAALPRLRDHLCQPFGSIQGQRREVLGAPRLRYGAPESWTATLAARNTP